MTSELEQIAREHSAPSVGVKRFSAPPGATIESEGALEVGDVALDAGTELSERPVGSSIARHFGDREAEVFAEDDVPDAECAKVGEIAARSKTTVEHTSRGTRSTAFVVLSTAATASVESLGLPARVCRSSTRPEAPVARQ